MLLNDGSGYFNDAPSNSIPNKPNNETSRLTRDVSTLDINNDGNLDLLLTNYTSDYSSCKFLLYTNQGNGVFIDESGKIDPDYSQFSCSPTRVGDINSDGLTDFVNVSAIFLNDGLSFVLNNEININLIGTDTWNLELGDLNGDENLNAIADAELENIVGSGFYSTEFIDLESDGDLDIFAAQYYPHGVGGSLPPLVYINDGNGSFHESGFDFGEASRFYHPINTVRSADFNNDGRVDVFVADFGLDVEPFGGNQNRIFIQNEQGILVDETQERLPQASDYTHGLALGDIDGDGDVDAYISNIRGENNAPSPRLLINDGSGYFSLSY